MVHGDCHGMLIEVREQIIGRSRVPAFVADVCRLRRIPRRGFITLRRVDARTEYFGRQIFHSPESPVAMSVPRVPENRSGVS